MGFIKVWTRRAFRFGTWAKFMQSLKNLKNLYSSCRDARSSQAKPSLQPPGQFAWCLAFNKTPDHQRESTMLMFFERYPFVRAIQMLCAKANA